MYGEQASRLGGAVVWRRTADGSAEPQRVLPDGCVDLIWADGALLVAGPDTAAHLAGGPADARFVGLRFAPGQGPAILGLPAAELRDQRVSLADLWPAGRVGALVERLAAAARAGSDRPAGAGGWAAPIAAALEWAAAERERQASPPDPLTGAILSRARGGEPVAATAAALGVGERRLRRHCLAAFGYGPKTLARILRMNAAVELARLGTPFARVAVAAGYADQAHLSREVRALAGVPLGVLIRP